MVKSISELSTKAVVDLRTALRQTIRVLHVDDDSGFLKVAKSFLEAQGPFEVETALSVEEALRKLGEKEYDIVVSDYRMPGQDGLEFLKETKQQDNTIPFIIFTGKGREEVAIKALNLGADGYFSKMGCPETVYGELAHGIRLAVERKRAEMEVLKKEERLRAILASSPDGIMISDLNADVVDCNEAALRLGEYSSKKEVVGKSGFEFIAEKNRKEAAEDLKEIFARGTLKNLEYTVLKKNGEEYLAELSASILKDSIGDPVGFVTVIRDISERKKAEEMLKESEQKFRRLVEEAALAMAVADTKGRLTYVNKATVDMLGYSTSQMVGQPFSDFLYPKDKGKIMRTFLKAIVLRMQPRLLEFRLVHKDGHVIHAMSRPTRLAVDGKTIGFQAIIIDITERKKAELAALESKEKFEVLFRGNPDAAVLVDPDSHVLDVNSRFEKLFGYDLAEIKGTHIKDLVVPENKIEEARSLDDKSVQGHVYFNTVRTKKDGSLVPVSIAGAPITVEGRHIGYVVMYKDISELKKKEHELALINEKLRVVGGLTRHDVRNKLSAIVGNTYLARRAPDRKNETIGYMQEIDQEVEEIVRILDFAKAYEMLGSTRLTFINLEKAFNEAVSAFSGLETVKVANDCHGVSVRADSLLVQLFYNLIDNSLKHGGKLTRIKVRCVDYGEQLDLIYEDDGVGIPREAKLRLFSEGFTTGRGSGYGLYLIRRMVEIYGWAIQEMGESGIGARFVITIPKTNSNGKENYRIA